MEFDKYGHIVVDGMLPQEHIPKVEDCPSPLMAMMPPPTESASSHPSILINGYEATSSRKRRVNPGKSDSWNHFDVVDVKKDDGTLETKARCRYCHKLMSCVASNGTSHLRRHTESCLSKNTHSIRPEQVATTPPGEVVVNSPFDQARACRDTAKLVIELELPFSWAEDSHFEEWVHSFNPHLEPISRHTIKDIVLEKFEEEKSVLRSLLQSISGKVCLTSTLWTTDQSMGYVCITAHFVDQDWKLNKRTISFPMPEYPNTEFTIFEAIYSNILSWNLSEKVFTITLDDDISIDVTRRLKDLLFTNNHSVGEQLFHVRCSTYILNKIVDEGLEGIHHSLENIRRSIRHVRSSKVNLQKFSELCKRAGMIFKNLPPDISCRWNTTYYMLDAAIPYQRIFELFFYDSIHDFIPSIIDWKNATVMRDLLKAFCESSKLFSGISNVSSSKFCHQLSNICLILSKYENDSSCRGVVGSMKSKLSEYWREIPLVLGLAACMDPRYKLTFLEVCLEVICGYDETHRLGGVVEKIKNALEELYKEYTKDSNVMKEVSDEYELKQGCNVEGSGVMSSASTQKEDLTFALYVKRTAHTSTSELKRYMSLPPVDLDVNDSFDVLDWWKAQSGNYPNLYAMARDLLTVPVSAVPLEYAFDRRERMMNQSWSCLPPELLEASLCLKDWYQAKEGSQDAYSNEIADTRGAMCKYNKYSVSLGGFDLDA